MSSNLFSTSPGGETPQYESIKTVTNETPKQTGQFGDLSSSETTDPLKERGEQRAEQIRYGQGISESGVGGMTKDVGGAAGHEGGYGGAKADPAFETADTNTRAAQGYGGKNETGEDIGA
ncbi:hypothetical protein L228DRAFT_33413 [Xylona heveae TC161]|uniref:Uncharacterized protein n=1 Tax=Xylona heveae (strain CBS 132557 / TC161) TaxID=1328760 RepID=A0A165A639_XYLHT|nr:hypothetical protein L228DRAFT_33413 [Xylona heveae TC161]KZF20003.1 hypothetical protein L228DRAFT_33413 [Xylona heveae TC161]